MSARGDDPEVREDQQGEAGGEQGEAPAQQQGQAGEAEKVHLQPVVQAGPQGPERHQHDGAAEAEVLVERMVVEGAQQGATQAECEQQYPEQQGGGLSFTHGRSLSGDGMQVGEARCERGWRFPGQPLSYQYLTLLWYLARMPWTRSMVSLLGGLIPVRS